MSQMMDLPSEKRCILQTTRQKISMQFVPNTTFSQGKFATWNKVNK